MFVLAVCMTASGCVSYSYVDESHVQHLIGFVSLSSDLSRKEGETGVSALRVSNFGVSVFSVAGSSRDVSLGYSKQMLLIVSNNTCVDINADGPCAARTIPPQIGTIKP